MTAPVPAPDPSPVTPAKALHVLVDFLSRMSPVREPVLFFTAVAAWIAAYHPEWVDTDLKKAFLTAVTAWTVRALSTPLKTAKENAAGQAYVGALEHQAVAQAAQVYELKAQQPPPRRPRPIDARAA